MSSRNPNTGLPYSNLFEILRRSNLFNTDLSEDDTFQQIINFYPNYNLENSAATAAEEVILPIGGGASSQSSLNPGAAPFIPTQNLGELIPPNHENNDSLPELESMDVPDVSEPVDESIEAESNVSGPPDIEHPVNDLELEEGEEVLPQYADAAEGQEVLPENIIDYLFGEITPEMRQILNRASNGGFYTTDAIGNQSNLYSFEVPIDAVSSLFSIRNPPGPTYEPNYLIEDFKELQLGISEIDFPYDGSMVKIYVPTIITVDNTYCQQLLRSQIINLKDILKEKEAALQIAYFIKTGEITPEVQPHHDELSGYTKQPLSKDGLESLKYTNIKDTPIFETLDESSSCSICQIPIKEALEDEQEVIVLECGDYFCKDCIFQWLEQYQNKCPNCNKVLSSVEEEPKPRLTREEILGNNYYKAAYFIIRYCSYYRQKQDINVQRLDQLNELFIQQGGLVSMNDCKSILEFD